MTLDLIHSKPAKITTVCTIITALTTGGYQGYNSLTHTLEQYAKKEDIVELKIYVENLRRGMSLDLLNAVIMGYEDELMVLEFEIDNNQGTAVSNSTKKNLERRISDLKQKRNILRIEISNNKKRMKI